MTTMGMGSIDRNTVQRHGADGHSPESAFQSESPLTHAFAILRSSGIPLGLWRVRIDDMETEAVETMVADAVGHLGAATTLPGGDVIFLQFSGLFQARRKRTRARWQPYLVVGMIAERLERLCGGGSGARAVVTFRAVRADEFSTADELIAALDLPPAQNVTIDMPGATPPAATRARKARTARVVPLNGSGGREGDDDDRRPAAGGN